MMTDGQNIKVTFLENEMKKAVLIANIKIEVYCTLTFKSHASL